MDYDDYSHDDYSYDGYSCDDQSYGFDDYDNDVSYEGYGQDDYDNYSEVSQDQYQNYEIEEVISLEDDNVTVRDTSDWEVCDSDDEYYTSSQTQLNVVEKKSKRSLKVPFFQLIRKKSVLDKSLAESSLQHVIVNLLGYDLDEPIYLSLLEHFENDVDMIKVLSMYEEEIDNLTYHDNHSSSPSKKDLHKSQKLMIKSLLGFAEHMYDEGIPAVFEDWTHVTRNEFQKFHIFYKSNPTSIPSQPIYIYVD